MEAHSELEEVRKEFDEVRKGYKGVHTNEELEIQRKKMRVVWERRWRIDEEFRAMIEAKTRESETRVGEMKYEMDMKRAEFEVKANLARTRAEIIRIKTMRKTSRKNTPLPSMEDLVENPDLISSVLICPICKDIDRGNIMNDKHICFKCMHELIPENELHKYNRKYRRTWTGRFKKRKR